MSTSSIIRGAPLLMALLLCCFSLSAQMLETNPAHGEYCAGEGGVILIATGLEEQIYQLEKWDDNFNLWVGVYTITTDGPGDYDFEEALWEEGAYRLFWEDNGAPVTSDEAVIIKKASPSTYTLHNASDHCSPVEPYLNNSQQGVTYRLLLNGMEVASEPGTGGLLEFGGQSGHGTYTAEGSYTAGAQCLVAMNNSIVAFKPPEEVAISPADGLCNGQTTEITFHDTEPNTTYYIMRNDEHIASIQSGDQGGDITLVHTFSEPGEHQVEAVSNETSCSITFDTVITVNARPQKFPVLTEEGCPGTEIGLDGCEDGVLYRLHFTPLTGDKGAEDETRSNEAFCANGLVSFGEKFQPGTYQIEVIDQDTGCSVWMDQQTTIHPQPVKYALTPDLSEACVEEVVIGLSQSQEGVTYTLMRNDEHPEGTVAGDGGPVSFPPPYEPGSYHIEAVFDEGSSCTSEMDGRITLYNAPTTYHLTVNGTIPEHHLFCADSGIDIGLDASQEGVEYRLHLPDGGVTAVDGDGEVILFGLFHGVGTYHVTAHRAGCSTPMTGNVRLSNGPAIYSLSASSHTFCAGDEESITITLANSQPGVLYMLQFNGSDLQDMDEITGDGHPLTWEQVSQYGPGDYTVRASFPLDGTCPSFTDPVTISTHMPPAVTLSLADDEICKGECTQLVFEYAGTTPLDIEYAAGNNAEVFSFDPNVGNTQHIQVCPVEDTEYTLLSATYADEPFCEYDLSGTSPVELIVHDNPTPFTLTSQDGNNCSPVTPVLSGSEAGVSYQLFRGSFPVGEAVPGDGDEIIFDEVTTSGTYHVEATSTTGCNTMMTNTLDVSTSPALLSVDPSGDTCLQDGITIGLSGGSTEAATRYTLLRDGVPQQEIETANSGDEVVFAGINQPGTYEIHAERLSSGCDRMMDGALSVHPRPSAFTVRPVSPSCPPSDVFITNSENNVDYFLYRNDSPVAIDPIAGEAGNEVRFPEVSESGVYTIKAVSHFGCERFMNGYATLQGVPEEVVIEPDETLCADTPQILTFINTEEGTDYQLIDEQDNIVNQFAGTGEDHELTVNLGAGTYHVRAITQEGGCEVVFDREIIVGPIPQKFPLKHADGCPDTEIILDGCEEGVLYFLSSTRGVSGDDGLKADQVLLAYACDDGQVNFGTRPPGTWRVRAEHPNGCEAWMEGETVIHPHPQTFQMTPDQAEACVDEVVIGLAQSQEGVTYVLIRNDEHAEGTVVGDGQPILFPPPYEPGSYHIEATLDEGHPCTKAMDGEITLHNAPNAYHLTVNGDVPEHYLFCAGSGIDIGLTDSEEGVEYHLHLPDNVVITASGDGNEISFGSFNDVGDYHITAHRAGCSTPMEGSVRLSNGPASYSLSVSSNTYCEGDEEDITLTLANSQPGVLYRLQLDGDLIPGTELPGNGSPLKWESISAHGEGGYRVEAIFPGDHTCPVFSNTINVQEIASLEVEMTIPNYDGPICKNSCISLVFEYDGPLPVFVTYTNGHDQSTMLLVPSAGPIYTVPNVCPQETSEYSLVSAHPQQHPGCITYFNDQAPIVVEVLDNPAVFQLEGIPAEPHGNNCSPVTPRLNGSQAGVNYHLYREGGTTPVDSKTGTGEVLNFEPLTTSGNYQVVAYNDDGCSKAMQGTVVVNALPDIYVIEPTGTICSHSNFSVGLDGGPQANTTYSLWHNSQHYGDIEAIDGDEANEVLFEGLNQPGIYQVLATNKETGCERMMAGELQAVQSPQVFKLKPEDPVCLPAQLYLNDSEENAIYGLWKSGGSLPVQLVPGTGEALYFETVHDAATYYVIASSTESECTRVMDGQTLVKGLPEIFTITPPPGNYCVDDEISIGLENTRAGVIYQLYHQGEPTGIELTGTGEDEPLEFPGNHNTPGTYKVKAVNVAGCTNWMEGEVKVNVLPYQYNLVKYIETEELCNPIEIGLEQSQINHHYVLLHDDDEVAVVIGTGHPISFGRVYDPGIYTAYGYNPATTCSIEMHGEKVVVQGPEYLAVSLENNNPYYCPEDKTGNSLFIATSEAGITYQLYRNGEPLANTEQEGDGGLLQWLDVGEHNGEEVKGEFYIVAFSDDPDCNVAMMNAYSIEEAITPVVGFMGDEQPVEIEECASNPLVLDIEFVGQLPMEVVYQLNGTEYFFIIDPAVHSSPFSFILPAEVYHPDELIELELLDVYYSVLPHCEGYVENELASVILTLPPSASMPVSLDICGLEAAALNPMGASHYSAFEWEIVQGGGYLSNPSVIDPAYIPDESDIGEVVIVNLYLTGVGHCYWLVETFSSTLTYYLAPVVDAGEDIHLCDDDPIVTLNGNISGSAEEARWVLPDNGGEISDIWDLGATYTPTMSEINQGETTLTLLMTNDPEGPCQPISDEVTIYFYTDVEVSAGDDRIVCASSPAVQLEGSIGGGAMSSTWTGGQGIFDPGPHDPQAIYTPHQSEILGGSVTLILETNDPDGPCHAGADEMTITIDPQPMINAGPDHVVLAGDVVFVENAAAHTYQEMWWEASGPYTGSFEYTWDNLFPVYYSSMLDSGETIFLLLKATGLAACAATEYQDTSMVKVGAPLEIDFEAIDNRADSTLCMRFPAYFHESIHYGGYTPHEDQHIAKRIWDFGDGTVYETTNPMDSIVWHTYQEFGQYQVEMIAKTAIDGIVIHSDTVIHEVDIRDCTSNNLVFPNALAPDHAHPEVQMFLPRGINIIEYELKIFDMRGNLVWRTTELDVYDGSPSEGWKGTYKNGDPAPQGTYVWQVYAKFSNGAVYGHSGESNQRNGGTVTLIR